MHYIKSRPRAWAFRRASIVLILTFLSILVTAGTVVNTLLQKTEESLWFFAIAFVSTLVLASLAMIASGSCRCQLCQASTMRSLKCNHHKNAKKLAGSYRLRIATSILFKGTYRCSYCGEAFSLKTKDLDRMQTVAEPPPRTSAGAQRVRRGRLAGQIPPKKDT